jgi:hypothetical protein
MDLRVTSCWIPAGPVDALSASVMPVAAAPIAATGATPLARNFAVIAIPSISQLQG